jgi:hypothetical protein
MGVFLNVDDDPLLEDSSIVDSSNTHLGLHHHSFMLTTTFIRCKKQGIVPRLLVGSV